MPPALASFVVLFSKMGRNVYVALDGSEHSSEVFNFYLNNLYRAGDLVSLLFVHERKAWHLHSGLHSLHFLHFLN